MELSETDLTVCEIQYGYANQYCVWYASAYVIMPYAKAKRMEEMFDGTGHFNGVFNENEVYKEVFDVLEKKLEQAVFTEEESSTKCYVDGIHSFKILRGLGDMEVLLEGKGDLSRIHF